MRQTKIIIGIVIALVLLINFNTVYAGGMLNTIFNSGTSWFSNATDQNSIGQNIADYITGDVLGLLITIGNLVFFIVAAFLGVKYIWSGVSGKSEVKETLPTFVVGATFFYSAQALYDFAKGGFNTLIFSSTSFEQFSGSLWTTITIIVRILSIAGIIAIGLKYMLSSANTKADIKKDLLPMIIGIIMVFSISEVMTFIFNLGQDLL